MGAIDTFSVSQCSQVMCCQNLAAHCQKQRHGSMSMLRCRCVSVTLPGWRSQQWEGSALPLARSAEGTVHLVMVLFYSLKQKNQIAPLINRAFSPAARGYCWAKDPSSRMSSYCSPRHLYCHVLARVERSDWMGSPQTSRTGMAISYHSLRGTLLHWRCVVPFYLFIYFPMQRHRENPHGHQQQEPKHPAGTETKEELRCQTPTSCSQWILLVDLRPGTTFGSSDKLIHDFISMQAFKLKTLNINGIHPVCGNAVLGVWTLAWSGTIVPVW